MGDTPAYDFGWNNGMVNFTNSGAIVHTSFWTLQATVVLCTTIVLLMIVAFLGNAMVILVVFLNKGMRTKTNVFILSLAISDFSMAAFCMPVSLITVISGKWIFSHGFCMINTFALIAFMIGVMHTMMYISIHKYLVIVNPLSQFMTRNKALMMVLAAWGFAVVCAIGPFLNWTKVEYLNGTTQCSPTYPDTDFQIFHAIFVCAGAFVVPLLVLTVAYLRTFYALHDHRKQVSRTTLSDEHQLVLAQHTKSVTMLFLAFLVYAVSWLPSVIYALLAVMNLEQSLPQYFNSSIFVCGYFTCACHPVLYVTFCQQFRQGFKQLLCAFRNENFSVDIGQPSPELPRRNRLVSSATDEGQLSLRKFISKCQKENQMSENRRHGAQMLQALELTLTDDDTLQTNLCSSAGVTGNSSSDGSGNSDCVSEASGYSLSGRNSPLSRLLRGVPMSRLIEDTPCSSEDNEHTYICADNFVRPFYGQENESLKPTGAVDDAATAAAFHEAYMSMRESFMQYAWMKDAEAANHNARSDEFANRVRSPVSNEWHGSVDVDCNFYNESYDEVRKTHPLSRREMPWSMKSQERHDYCGEYSVGDGSDRETSV